MAGQVNLIESYWHGDLLASYSVPDYCTKVCPFFLLKKENLIALQKGFESLLTEYLG